jgi:hypothetical protein
MTASGEMMDHVPPGQIIKDAALNTVVNVVSLAIAGSLTYKPSDEDIAAAKGMPFEDLEAFQYSGTRLVAIRASAGLGGNIWNSIQYYQAFTAEGAPQGAGVTVTGS